MLTEVAALANQRHTQAESKILGRVRLTRYHFHAGTRFERKAAAASSARSGLFKLVFAIALCFGCAIVQPAAAADTDAAIGNTLADMLRASRSVVSASQPLINDAAIGDKGFTGEMLVNKAEVIYTERVGAPLVADNLSARDLRLIDAQRQAIRLVVDDHQDEINQRDVGFKGFIPAVFARLVNEKFVAIAGAEARIRVTAPSNLVRNRKARPDPWEKNILETRLMAADWPLGKPFTEEVEFEGRPAFRMLLPEYYRESCLACHGEPKGEPDITSYPKEGGKVGDLGGAISIVIFR